MTCSSGCFQSSSQKELLISHFPTRHQVVHGKTESRLPGAAAEQLQGRGGCTGESCPFLMKHLMKNNTIHFQEESAEQNTLWNVTFLSIAGQDRT